MPTCRIYLDANATTPVCETAREAALQAMTLEYGNPSSPHAQGLRARALLERSRGAAAELLGVAPQQCIFTSGATEAIHIAVFSALLALRERRTAAAGAGAELPDLLLLGATEHKAVGQALAHWNHILGLQLPIVTLEVDARGHHRLDPLDALLPRCALLCTMAANNETGVISDLDAIEARLVATASPALWLVDSVQALGKLDLALARRRIDYASFSGHKLYTPKGVGLLYVRPGSPLTALTVGGGQEGGQRAGTENLPGIAAFGAVCAALLRGAGPWADHAGIAARRERLLTALRQAFDGLELNADPADCLPTTINFAVRGASSRQLIALFDAAGLQLSAGSACSSGLAQGSPVLDAMGRPGWASSGAVRLSFGALDDDAFIARACTALVECGQRWRLHGPASAAAATPDAARSDVAAPGIVDSGAEAAELDWDELPEFTARHPDALLVDVRADYESLAAALPPELGALRALRVPMERWPSFCAGADGRRELGERMVLLLCRSGKRSQEAARHLLSLGHARVAHLGGGLALRPD